MRERLIQEALPAILAWIVAGAAKWRAEGTNPPQSVRESTAEYLAEQDTVGQWLAERCKRDSAASELSAVLHRDYGAWCNVQRITAVSNKMLSDALASEGFAKKRTRDGARFNGLRLSHAQDAV